MTTVIKNGTIVTADLTYKADVLIEGGRIAQIGEGLKGDTVLDATGCYVMPGGIDPHTHLEMPFMGTYSTDDFESGTRAALAGGTTMVVDFVLPGQGQGLLDAKQMWHNKSGRANCDYSYHMAVTWWGEKVFDDMKTVIEQEGITTFKHFMAYKGALMVNDDEMYASFKRLGELGGIALVHAENGDVVAELSAKLLADGNTGPEAHAYSRPPQVEGEATNRAIMIADMAGVPLYVVHTSCEDSHEAIRRARMQGKRVWGEPLIQHLTLDESEYFNKDWDHAARRVMSPPFRNKQHQDSL
ncbi:MAG: amidohydrolase family protein, partial [Albidovulum sp.]|uniref:amidohydrolase family protein n=1 Tax=Albidovulum sp. TaxID=1872424 RepID=UPI003CB435D8